jgi:hypothetical protein
MPGEDIKVFSFVNDPWQREIAAYQFLLDSILLGPSVIAKLTEFFVQWKYSDFALALITLSSRLFSVVVALVLHLHDIRRIRQDSEIDIVAGSLPTCSTAGGAHKILLGIPKGRHQHVL